MTCTTMTETPTVWIADLAAYNSAYLHGKWIAIDADTTEDDLMAEVRAIMATSPVAGDYERGELRDWAIFDFDNFGEIRLDEYTPLGEVVSLAHGLIEHGPAWSAYVADIGRDYATAEGFSDHYAGHYEAAEDYAREHASDLLDGVSETVAAYFDWQAYARDLEYGGAITVIRRHDGDGVDIFTH